MLVAALRAAARGRPDPVAELPSQDTAPLRRIGALLAAAGDAVRDGESAEEVLWRVWQGSGLGPRWTEASARGGPVGAAADRDLDAVLALFDAAAKHTDRLPGADVAGFTEYLADQQLPGDSLAARSPPGEAVALLTAHAARGREWDVVAVPAVQEGSWPDLRLRGSLLGNERLVDLVAGTATPGQETVSRAAPLLAEERRLFYVACTRARHTLLVSAVSGEDEQPSRFLDELDPVPADQADRPGAPAQPSAGAGRAGGRAAPSGVRAGRRADDPPDPARRGARADRRQRAARQLARLADAGVPGAHPDDWYGLAAVSSDGAVAGAGRGGAGVAVGRREDRPLPAALGAGTPRRQRAGRAGRRHRVARARAGAGQRGRRGRSRAGGGAARRRGRSSTPGRRGSGAASSAGCAACWPRSTAGCGPAGPRGCGWWPWSSRSGWTCPAPSSTGPADAGGALQLRGRVDRLEVDADGRPVVVDVKTGKVAVSGRAAAEHPQLAIYQLAAALGAFGTLLEPGARPGGARLVYLADQKATGQVKEPVQPPLDDPDLARWEGVLRRCARESSGSQFVARAGPDCDRCPVRTSCPLNEAGRPLPEA